MSKEGEMNKGFFYWETDYPVHITGIVEMESFPFVLNPLDLSPEFIDEEYRDLPERFEYIADEIVKSIIAAAVQVGYNVWAGPDGNIYIDNDKLRGEKAK